MQMNSNISSTRTNGINVKIILQCTMFHKILQNLKYIVATVTEFRFNRIKKNKNMKNL